MEPSVAWGRIIKPATPSLGLRGCRCTTPAREHPQNAARQQRSSMSMHKPMKVGLLGLTLIYTARVVAVIWHLLYIGADDP